MDRLTYKGAALFDKECFRSKTNKKETIKRLAEYENTGKTPEEILKLADDNQKLYRDNKTLWQAIAIMIARYGDVIIPASDIDQYWIQPSEISLYYDWVAEEYHIEKRKRQPADDEMTV